MHFTGVCILQCPQRPLLNFANVVWDSIRFAQVSIEATLRRQLLNWRLDFGQWILSWGRQASVIGVGIVFSLVRLAHEREHCAAHLTEQRAGLGRGIVGMAIILRKTMQRIALWLFCWLSAVLVRFFVFGRGLGLHRESFIFSRWLHLLSFISRRISLMLHFSNTSFSRILLSFSLLVIITSRSGLPGPSMLDDVGRSVHLDLGRAVIMSLHKVVTDMMVSQSRGWRQRLTVGGDGRGHLRSAGSPSRRRARQRHLELLVD